MPWSVNLNLIVTTLAGIGLFATCISAERESGTLSLSQFPPQATDIGMGSASGHTAKNFGDGLIHG